MQNLSNNEFVSLLEEKQQTILKLQSENDVLMNIIALIPGNIFWKDTEGKFLGCNNNVAKLFGYQNAKEIAGKTNADFFDPEQLRLANQLDLEISTSNEEKLLEEKGFNVNHQPAIYLSKKAPLFDSNHNRIGILGVSFDITDRKKVEEDLKIAKKKAEASSRAKSQFLAVINHELRTPLTSIVGLLDFLRRRKISKEEKKNIIAAIDNCTQHLLSLVNEILEFTRLDTGRYNTRYERVNINNILKQTFEITKTLAKKKRIDLKIKKPTFFPPVVLTDARIILQILINLVSNAIKFTEQGHVIIDVRYYPKKNKNKYEFRIVDTGLGIPFDKLGLIFEPFQQLEDAYRRQSSRSGTGLGLTIVEKLAELIGAKIEVKSIPNKGSIFSLVCDFEVCQSTDKVEDEYTIVRKKTIKEASKGKTLYPDILTKKPYVLLVEDDPIVLYVHKKMLDDLGCEVEAVTHGKEAIQKLTPQHDMVFVDISLPDISGFEVIKRIRAKSEFTNLPIIALTVYTGREEKMACLNAGANKFASKPITRLYLKKMMLNYLQSHRKA